MRPIGDGSGDTAVQTDGRKHNRNASKDPKDKERQALARTLIAQDAIHRPDGIDGHISIHLPWISR